MGLIKNLAIKFKEEKKENYVNFFLNEQTKDLKLLIKELSSLRRRDQKKSRENKVYLILKKLSEIDRLYSGFIRDLNNLKTKANNNEKTHELLIFMIEKRKSLRKEFESIYINFKHTAMGLEDVPMKNILKKMQSCFGFDGEKYSDKDLKNHSLKYYDSTTMQIRFIS